MRRARTKYFVEDDCGKNVRFATLAAAVDYADAHKGEGRQLVHIGWFNLSDTGDWFSRGKTREQLFEECEAILKRIGEKR